MLDHSFLKALPAIAFVAALLPALSGCKNKAKACYDEGDEASCNALCETGKPEHMPTCFEMRARALVACVDGKGDCTAACQAWKNAAASSDDVRNVYVAKLGSEAKVKTANTKCGIK